MDDAAYGRFGYRFDLLAETEIMEGWCDSHLIGPGMIGAKTDNKAFDFRVYNAMPSVFGRSIPYCQTG